MAGPGGIAVVSTAPVTIGITRDQFEVEYLKRREQEILNELAQTNASERERKILLEKELAGVQAKSKNPEAALEDYKNKLAQAYRALDDLRTCL